MNFNVATLITEVKELKRKSNEAELMIFTKIAYVKQQDLWKQKGFYKGSPDLETYMVASFDKFIYELLGHTIQWYKSMEDFLKIKDESQQHIVCQ